MVAEWPYLCLVPKSLNILVGHHVCLFEKIVWLPAGPFPLFQKSLYLDMSSSMCVEIPILSAKERIWPSVGDWPVVTSEKRVLEAMSVGPFKFLQHKDIAHRLQVCCYLPSQGGF